jgi:protein-tyrosine phosphatase
MFRIDWVLTGELAIGPAPRAQRHLDRLEQAGVRSVLSLTSEAEALLPSAIAERFAWIRLVLPDHRSDRLLQVEELEHSLLMVAELRQQGPVFVHCLAAMERSPLVCLAWLRRQRGLDRIQALDYLMQIHPGTCPLPAQLAILDLMVY